MPGSEKNSTKTGRQLLKDWGLTDNQINEFLGSYTPFGADCIDGARERILRLVTGPLAGKEQAIYTALSAGCVCAVFAQLNNLGDKEAQYILEVLQEKTDEFIARRKVQQNA